MIKVLLQSPYTLLFSSRPNKKQLYTRLPSPTKQKTLCFAFLPTPKVSPGLTKATLSYFFHVLERFFPNTPADLAFGLGYKHLVHKPLWTKGLVTKGYLLQHGLAHKSIWSLKRDSGTKFCIFCSNLVSRRSSLHQEVLTTQAFDPSALQLATDQASRAGTFSKEDFRLWEQAVGFNYNEYALPCHPILGPHLKPCSQFVYDWVHTMFVGGVFPVLMGLALNSLQAEFKTNVYKLLADYMKLWTLPGSIKDDMSSLFSKKRHDANKEAGIFKCTAGEGLGLYPLFAFWLAFAVRPIGSCTKAITCFLALADPLDLIQGVIHIEPAADLIDDAVSNLLSRCLDCNYVGRMASKFHWFVHFGFHIRKFQEAGLGQMLPSCFVQERKHKVAKRYGQGISNTTKFKYSILNEIVCQELAQLEELDQFSQACRLVKKSVAPKKLATLVRQMYGSNIQDIGTCA